MGSLLLLAAALCEALAVSALFGLPDWPAARALFLQSDVSDASVTAAVVLGVWALIGGTALVGVRSAVAAYRRARNRSLLVSWAVLVAGVLILTMGLAHVRTDPLPLAGGSPTEAQQLAR